MVLKAIADGELSIWRCNFGSPGSMNDINILDIIEGRMMPDFEYILMGNKRNLCYYLVDGIYPKWDIFFSSVSQAI